MLWSRSGVYFLQSFYIVEGLFEGVSYLKLNDAAMLFWCLYYFLLSFKSIIRLFSCYIVSIYIIYFFLFPGDLGRNS